MKKHYTLLAFSLSMGIVFAQVSAERLDLNQSQIEIGNDGNFFRGSNNQPYGGYSVPKTDGTMTMYAMSIWASGYDSQGDFHVSSANEFNPVNHFTPGPISTTLQYNSTLYQSEYGTSIWKIDRGTIDQHIANYSSAGYIVPTEIAEWPGNGNASLGTQNILAPFVDLNNNEIYEPELGEYPHIRGNAAIYTIFNDEGESLGTDSSALGVEVHAMAYQFDDQPFLDHNSFIQFKVFNFSGEAIQDFKLALYSDHDLGNPHDDYFGCDPTRNLLLTYNSDDQDESDGANIGFGIDPPAFGIKSLNANLGSVARYIGYQSSSHSDIASYFENYSKGLWPDGDTMYYGGTGVAGSPGATNTPTSFVFSSNPNDSNGWSMETEGLVGTDIRSVMVCEPVTLNKEDFECFDFAFIYARESGQNRLGNVNTLLSTSDQVQTFHDSQYKSDCSQFLSLTEITNESNALQVFPNPLKANVQIKLPNDADEALVSVYSLNGKKILSQGITHAQSSLNLEALEDGMYVLQISTDSQNYTRKIQKLNH